MKISVIFLDLPKKRHQRKCEQLENLATAVLEVHRPADIIVDFCSGGVGRNVDWDIQLHYMLSSPELKTFLNFLCTMKFIYLSIKF